MFHVTSLYFVEHYFFQPLPYYPGNTPWLIEYINFSCNFTFFHHTDHISLQFLGFFLLTYFFLIRLFLSLNISPCHLPYITELLTFPSTCHSILLLTLIKKKTPKFVSASIFFRLLIFVAHWTYAATIQNSNLAIRITFTIYSYFSVMFHI